MIHPRTAIDLLALKLCEGNRRSKNKVDTSIEAHEDKSFRENGTKITDKRKVTKKYY